MKGHIHGRMQFKTKLQHLLKTQRLFKWVNATS